MLAGAAGEEVVAAVGVALEAVCLQEVEAGEAAEAVVAEVQEI